MMEWERKANEPKTLLDELRTPDGVLKDSRTIIKTLLWQYALLFMNKDNSTIH